MRSAARPQRHDGARFRREVGTYGDDTSGPLFVTVGGIHGNEPAGVLASERVLAQLVERRPRLRGRFVALAGNLRALALDQRYVESDLNRMWREDQVRRLRAQDPSADSPEQGELRELFAAVDGHLTPWPERVIVLDLHTMSAGGSPFQCMGDTLQNRHVAYDIPIPLILGLEEVITGSLLEFVGERGHVAIAVEGGQHRDPRTVEHHEAAIWLALVAAGLLEAADVPDLQRHRARLSAASRGVPHVVEIVHRHPTLDGDGFEMLPGFRNFHPVSKGDALARDHRGPIASPVDGYLLLPRYQGLGNDGFFVAREVRPVWLRVSALLRRLRAERILRLLPGVARDAANANRLLVDRRIARFLAVEVFHLFGYRRREVLADGRLAFERRREGKPW